jgi:hypothetical protein
MQQDHSHWQQHKRQTAADGALADGAGDGVEGRMFLEVGSKVRVYTCTLAEHTAAAGTCAAHTHLASLY